MINLKAFVTARKKECWQFTVNTAFYSSTWKKTGIPFNLYDQTGIELTIDWGDNTTSALTSSDYTIDDTTAGMHEYAEPGVYTVKIYSSDWSNTYLLGYEGSTPSQNNKNASIYWFRYSVTSIDKPLPAIPGIKVYVASSLNTYNNSFYAAFYDCSCLQSIPFDLFYNNPNATSFYECFRSCTRLQSIPTGLFDKHTAVTTFTYVFAECRAIQSIPAGLFDKNTIVNSFSYAFFTTPALQSIPAGLFDKNTTVTSFDSCFRECTSLQSIPAGLFDKNTAVTTFYNCFRSCTQITSIPSGLFKNNTLVTTFSYCFYNCTSLQSVPSKLFANNTAVTGVTCCFQNCSSLLNFHLRIGSSSISSFAQFVPDASNVDRVLCVPASSTTYNAATSFANSSNGIVVTTNNSQCLAPLEFGINTEATRAGEKTTAIPFNLYSQYGITLTVDWGDGTASTLTQANYTELNTRASIHEYVIPGEYTVTINSNNWANTYILNYDVYGGGYIYSDQYDAEAALYWWRRTLVSICDELPPLAGTIGYTYAAEEFDEYTSDVLWSYSDNFDYLFAYCEKLTMIPETLFANNTNTTDLCGCFLNCGGITSIPAGLLTELTNLMNISEMFKSCYNLTSIPETLFNTNTNLYNIDSTFEYCRALNGFSLRIVSDGCNDVTSFVTKKTDVTRTIYVPLGSITQSEFESVASSLGLTIIGEDY